MSVWSMFWRIRLAAALLTLSTACTRTSQLLVGASARLHAIVRRLLDAAKEHAAAGAAL